jgi:hypothetical protein
MTFLRFVDTGVSGLALCLFGVSRQARSFEGAIPSSRAIWLNGRPLLASNPTASYLNSSVN